MFWSFGEKLSQPFKLSLDILSERHQRCSINKVVLKNFAKFTKLFNSPNTKTSQKYTYARASFLIKLQAEANSVSESTSSKTFKLAEQQCSFKQIISKQRDQNINIKVVKVVHAGF